MAFGEETEKHSVTVLRKVVSFPVLHKAKVLYREMSSEY